MEIRLKNIGIIEDSTLSIEGLTVITGHNNSGKTTVGKAAYSIIDATSDIEKKAENDKFFYAAERLKELSNTFMCKSAFKEYSKYIKNSAIRIFFEQSYYNSISKNMMKTYIQDLIHALYDMDIQESLYILILQRYEGKYHRKIENFTSDFEDNKEDVIDQLDLLYKKIYSDDNLEIYTLDSINATLGIEFSGQIQTISENYTESLIDIKKDKLHYMFPIRNNRVIKHQPIESMPYTQAYFIDNPFIVDEPIFYGKTDYIKEDSYLSEAFIITHDNKLKRILFGAQARTILEDGMIGEQYRNISEKINAILPGKFEDTAEASYYIDNGKKIKMANLATGAKMFSIIKLLLEKGRIDNSTLLILDEPEAHLHPEWQNAFAEIIILLIKEIGCHVLLTTHSPNFTLALEAYMQKYQIVSKSNFYQTKKNAENGMVSYQNVSQKIEDIYGDFAKYLSEAKELLDSVLYEDIEEYE